MHLASYVLLENIIRIQEVFQTQLVMSVGQAHIILIMVTQLAYYAHQELIILTQAAQVYLIAQHVRMEVYHQQELVPA